jgi:hypothetical protein
VGVRQKDPLSKSKVFQKHFQRTTKRFNIRENYELFLLTPFIIFIAELKGFIFKINK